MLKLFEKTFKYALMILIFCFLPLWVLLPVAVAGLLSEWFGHIAGIFVGVLFGAWFYGAGIMMFPFDSGFFKHDFWDV